MGVDKPSNPHLNEYEHQEEPFSLCPGARHVNGLDLVA